MLISHGNSVDSGKTECGHPCEPLRSHSVTTCFGRQSQISAACMSRLSWIQSPGFAASATAASRWASMSPMPLPMRRFDSMKVMTATCQRGFREAGQKLQRHDLAPDWRAGQDQGMLYRCVVRLCGRAGQGPGVALLTAAKAVKLKHWNQSITESKPARCRRSWCA